MKNGKTTVGGIIAAVGLSMTAIDNPTMKLVGIILAAAGSLLTGTAATDANKPGA